MLLASLGVCLIAAVGQRTPCYGGRKAWRIKKGEDILTSTETVCLEHAMYYGKICFWRVQASCL